MAQLLFASPPTQPPIETPRVNPTIGMTWTSWDGTVWDLVSGAQGVALQSGVRGLNMPSITRYTQTFAGVHGSRGTGWVAQEREVFWPVLLYKPTGDPTWADLDALFWRSMHPERPGTWSVKGPSPHAETRTLSCKFQSDGGHSMGAVPSVRGWERYNVYLAAEKPFWLGPTISDSWGPGAPTPFFGAQLTISSGSSTATATVSNPGDLEAWPMWTIIGPVGSASIGLNGRQISAPFAVPAGKALRIDTDPTRQTIRFGDWDAAKQELRNGVDRFTDMGNISFTPIPAGQNLPLQLTLQEPGTTAGVLMSLTPRYFRAWGN